MKHRSIFLALVSRVENCHRCYRTVPHLCVIAKSQIKEVYGNKRSLLHPLTQATATEELFIINAALVTNHECVEGIAPSRYSPEKIPVLQTLWIGLHSIGFGEVGQSYGGEFDWEKAIVEVVG